MRIRRILEAPITGKLIRGLNEAQTKQGVEGIFCAGVSENGDGQLINSEDSPTLLEN